MKTHFSSNETTDLLAQDRRPVTL